MTTIAYDVKTLAADGQSTSNDIAIQMDRVKIRENIGQYKAVAHCGDIIHMDAFIEWIKAGESGEALSKGDGGLICIDHLGNCYTYRPSTSKTRQKEIAPISDGSGWIIALAAMKAGADAVKAVEIASTMDIYTGGKIRSWTLGPLTTEDLSND